MTDTFKIVRFFQDAKRQKRTVKKGLTLEQAQAHCKDPQTNSKTATGTVARRRTRECGPWFDGYESEGS